ncbi:MAG: hypothetical protein ACE5GW_06040 [Planctomycetota bacterium]
MSDFNVREVIQKSASDVPLNELAKKGLKKVKVLDRSTICRLIEEAVDRVVKQRLETVSATERGEIEEEARAEVEALLKDHQDQGERKSLEYREQVANLKAEAANLRAELAERDTELERYRGGGAPDTLTEAIKAAILEVQPEGAGGDLGILKKSIDSLAAKVARGVGGSAGMDLTDPSDQKAIESLFSNVSSGSVESNIKNVNVKKTTAGGVSKTLEKLREMKQGGE